MVVLKVAISNSWRMVALKVVISASNYFDNIWSDLFQSQNNLLIMTHLIMIKTQDFRKICPLADKI